MQLDKRAFQQDIADDPHRFQVAVIHRRGGKTLYGLDWLCEQARRSIDRPGKPIRNYYVCPYRMQAKAVAFDFLQELVADDDVIVNKTDLYVQWKDTRNRVQLLGADGYDKHRGRYADSVVFDETAQIPPAAWREVFRPMLADTKGRALFIGTPRGRGFFRQLFDMQEKSDSWSSHYLPASVSGLIDEAELADLRAEMTDAEYRREIECDWDVGAPGAYFTAAMDASTDQVVPGELWDENELVWASWGLEQSDTITVTFWQVHGKRPKLIAGERFLQSPIHEVAKAVKERPYVYGGHCYRVEGIEGATPFRLQALRQLGFGGPLITRREWVDEVHLVRQLIPRTIMAAEGAVDAVEALRQCRATFNEETQSFSAKPVLDWALDYAHSVAGFAAYYRRGTLNARREPIHYPEVTRA